MIFAFDFGAPLRAHEWAREVAGILPLSALLEFLDASRVFHNYQLTGNTAWWCWTITPAGSRMLLSRSTTDQTCILDDFDASKTPTCLDGRWGDIYPQPNPETLRLCLATVEPIGLENNHKNMQRNDIRPHTVHLVHVKRCHSDTKNLAAKFPDNAFGLASRLCGWVTWAAMIAFSVVSTSWLLLTFLLLVTGSGAVVSCLFPPGPRKLRSDKGSEWNRLVLSAQHMNDTHWTIYYGESTIVNALLNWPLRLEKRPGELGQNVWLKRLLRMLVIGQWAMTIGAAALKDLNAYGISFWILFCIGMNAWSFTAERSAAAWLRYVAVGLERYNVEVSSRRALLNLVLALNPDTFALDKQTEEVFDDKLSPSAVLWIDSILKDGESRSQWEEASRLAMIDARVAEEEGANTSQNRSEASNNAACPGAERRDQYSEEYWFKFIGEGIQVAQMLKRVVKGGRRVAAS